MDAEAERGVAVLEPVDDDVVGQVERRRIAVRRRERNSTQSPRFIWQPWKSSSSATKRPSSPGRRRAATPRRRAGSAPARRRVGGGRRHAWRGARGSTRSRSRRVDAGEEQQHGATAHVRPAEPFAEQLDIEQVGDEVVGRFDLVLGDALVEVSVELVAVRDAFVGGTSTASRALWTNRRTARRPPSGRPSMRAITSIGMCWAYRPAPSNLRAPVATIHASNTN